jgi:hypothetical protein
MEGSIYQYRQTIPTVLDFLSISRFWGNIVQSQLNCDVDYIFTMLLC